MVEEKNIGNELFSWDANEFQAPSRSFLWYVVVWGVAVLAIAYAIYVQNWFLIGLVAMIVFSLHVLGRISPRKFTHIVTDKGVKVGDKLYSYDSLKSFWMVESGGEHTLNLITARKFDLLLTLQIDGGDVEKVRQILAEFLPEEEDRGEDTIDKITRFFKF